MHYENEKFVSSIVRITNEIAYKVITSKGYTYEKSENYLLAFLNINSSQLRIITSYIVNFIPYKIYLEKYSDIRNYLQFQIIQNVINMLLQEDISNTNIPYYLESIKDLVLFKLMNQTYLTN